MDDRDKRKMRMQELIQKNKDSREPELDPVLKEIIEVLHPGVEALSVGESQQMYDDLQNKFPFVWWGRIDWDNFKDKIQIYRLEDIFYNLNKRYQVEDYTIFALWGYSSGDSPVIKLNLRNAINHIDDINAVGGDQWLYCPSHGFVIEFYHDGETVIGFES